MKRIPIKKYALVLGNGPSLSKINWDKFYQHYNKNEVDIYCISYFFNGTIDLKLKPNYIILSDPEHFNVSNHKTLKMFNYLQNDKNIIIYCPLEFKKKIEPILKNNTIIYFNDLSLIGITRNIKPNKIRGYISQTFMKALAITLDREYLKIFIAGLDGSEFMSIEINAKNELTMFPSHQVGMSNISEQGVKITEYYLNGIVDYFYDLALTYFCYKSLLYDDRILNLNPYSFVDAYLKDDQYYLY
jgi:hypothetical protein